MIGLLLRMFSYVYHLVLCLFLAGIAVIAFNSSSTLHLSMLPWSGPELPSWLLWGSIAGLLSIALAITGKFRFLFPLWTLIVLILMVQGFLFKPYVFEGRASFFNVLWLIAGAAIAFLASLTLLRPRHDRRA